MIDFAILKKRYHEIEAKYPLLSNTSMDAFNQDIYKMLADFGVPEKDRARVRDCLWMGDKLDETARKILEAVS